MKTNGEWRQHSEWGIGEGSSHIIQVDSSEESSQYIGHIQWQTRKSQDGARPQNALLEDP